MPFIETLASFWSGPVLATNVLVLMHLVGSMLLGLLVGYERSSHGRAAGMRTYGLVCMASTALTVIGGYSSAWFGGADIATNGSDTTRVIQGIVSGIGFLCAGVIMHQGATVRGINTAATVWCASAVGVLAGMGQVWWAGLVAVLIVFANFTLHFVEHRILKAQQDTPHAADSNSANAGRDRL